MGKLERKSFEKPEETRSIDKGKIDVVKLGDVTAMRVRFEPGWKWSTCVKPVAKTEWQSALRKMLRSKALRRS